MSRARSKRRTTSSRAKKAAAEYEAHCDYLSAWEEDKYMVAQANVRLDEKGTSSPNSINARQARQLHPEASEEIEYMDVSPKQLVSVAASLIPFLENDDANRALMGSNMQRQAVPLLRAEAPFVGTGMERVTARDSGAVILCKRAGVVDSVDSERIIVRVDGGGAHEGQMSREVGADIYQMTKFKRSNQNTCINQKPIVHQGQKVKKGDVLADGPCTEMGELALGRNVLVAFMPWRGYNFEDAIVVSEKLVKEDYYTSIHIEEFEVDARDTKLGPEEITRDIPNIAEALLDEPRRVGHHPRRRLRQAGRHPGRQGNAEGRNAVDPGRETPPRDLRRKGRRREGRLALLPAGHRRHRSSIARCSRARVPSSTNAPS